MRVHNCKKYLISHTKACVVGINKKRINETFSFEDKFHMFKLKDKEPNHFLCSTVLLSWIHINYRLHEYESLA